MSEEEKRDNEAAAVDAAGAASETATPEAAPEKAQGGVTRRQVVIGAASVACLLGLGSLRYVGHNPLCRPPGGQDEAHLVNACIRCEKCYEACPRKVIVPAHIEDGLLGMRSPMLDFESDYCDFCAKENGGHPLCVQACPTNALELPEGATALNTIIGVADLEINSCLAYRDTGCRYCYDACVEAGYNAIQLTDDKPYPRPVVDADKCVGCGACESVCASLSNGSIVAGSSDRRAIIVKPITSAS